MKYTYYTYSYCTFISCLLVMLLFAWAHQFICLMLSRSEKKTKTNLVSCYIINIYTLYRNKLHHEVHYSKKLHHEIHYRNKLHHYIHYRVKAASSKYYSPYMRKSMLVILVLFDEGVHSEPCEFCHHHNPSLDIWKHHSTLVHFALSYIIIIQLTLSLCNNNCIYFQVHVTQMNMGHIWFISLFLIS